MMLIGCAMTSPETISSYLSGTNIPHYILPIGTKLNDTTNKNTFIARSGIKHNRITLILTYQDLRNNLKRLNKSRNNGKIFLVFAPVLKFRDLVNVTLMDVVSTDINITQSYKFKPADFSLLHKPAIDCFVEIKHEDYISQLIEKALSGSILTKLMTLLYQIPNSKVQNTYRDLIIGWFVLGDDKIKTVSTLISTLPDKKLLSKLIKLIEESKNYKDVFIHIKDLKSKNKIIDFDKLSVKFEVSDFDLRYMLSVSATMESSK